MITAFFCVSDAFFLLVCDGYGAEETSTAGFARHLFALAVYQNRALGSTSG